MTNGNNNNKEETRMNDGTILLILGILTGFIWACVLPGWSC